MANTYELIASNTSFAGGTAVSFTSIPNTYTDLVLHLNARASGYNGSDIIMVLNELGSGYAGKYIMKDGNSTTLTYGTSGSSAIYSGIIPGTQAGSNAYGSGTFYFPNYTSSTGKTVRIDMVSERNGNDQWLTALSGYSSNTSAISTIRITSNAGNFLGSSTAYLYGIKNS